MGFFSKKPGQGNTMDTHIPTEGMPGMSSQMGPGGPHGTSEADRILDEAKQKYIGTNWQFVQSNTHAKRGEVGTVMDVVMSNGQFLVEFNNGQKVNMNLMGKVCRESEDPFMYDIKKPGAPNNVPGAGPIKNDLVDGSNPLKQMSEIKNADSALKNEMGVNMQFPMTDKDLVTGQAPQQQQAPPKQINRQQLAKELFNMFEAEAREITLKITMPMPEMSLVKMMFRNANNSEKFIENLSDYVLAHINRGSIHDSLIKLLLPPKAASKQKTTGSRSKTTKPGKKTNDKKNVKTSAKARQEQDKGDK